MHTHTCIECDREFPCDGDEDLNAHDVMACDRWPGLTALCPECDGAAERERDRDEAAKDAYWQRKLDEARGK